MLHLNTHRHADPIPAFCRQILGLQKSGHKSACPQLILFYSIHVTATTEDLFVIFSNRNKQDNCIDARI